MLYLIATWFLITVTLSNNMTCNSQCDYKFRNCNFIPHSVLYTHLCHNYLFIYFCGGKGLSVLSQTPNNSDCTKWVKNWQWHDLVVSDYWENVGKTCYLDPYLIINICLSCMLIFFAGSTTSSSQGTRQGTHLFSKAWLIAFALNICLSSCREQKL